MTMVAGRGLLDAKQVAQLMEGFYSSSDEEAMATVDPYETVPRRQHDGRIKQTKIVTKVPVKGFVFETAGLTGSNSPNAHIGNFPTDRKPQPCNVPHEHDA